MAQRVACLTTDALLTADPKFTSSEFHPGLVSPIHSWRLILISMVILLPSAESFKKGCCQLQVKVCAQSTQ